MRLICLHRLLAGRQMTRSFTTVLALGDSSAATATTTTSTLEPTVKSEGKPVTSTTEPENVTGSGTAPSFTGTQEDEVARMKAAFGEREDGGESSIEYEDGVATNMKRSVRNNMFRYI